MNAESGDTVARGQAWEKLWALVKDIRTGMMTTVDGQSLRSRPMTGHAAPKEGEIWFFTRSSSHKAGEIEASREVNVAYADPKLQSFVSVSGRARLVYDRVKVDELWNPFVSAWFPEGKDDPDLALLCIDVEQAEYWDGPASKMIQLWRLVEAKAGHHEPDMGENQKL
ncbi:General stress protein 26 [Arboricoccus pini]|uniref:General stress protein 26 n=1 Tax=Arboricoccus pini TaxID=1963835 RepID=A0A212PZ59_9PROT|nr:pyridoxamine 5'-phosphate oxidase family protein [Arboricoccus pini]SNB52385.1 General stress protein 26 [Arboricoccus pini]